MTRLQQIYKDTIAPKLQEQFGFKSNMQIPKITKITLNMGLGEAVSDKKVIEHAVRDLEQVSGQKPQVIMAKKSVANFKIREGWPNGVKVTLRRERMYEFLDRLVNFTIPRIRDFRGLSPKAFDGQGNYNMGMTEQIAFPEIDYDKIDKLRGLNISITTTARSDEEGRALLAAFQFPFRG